MNDVVECGKYEYSVILAWELFKHGYLMQDGDNPLNFLMNTFGYGQIGIIWCIDDEKKRVGYLNTTIGMNIEPIDAVSYLTRNWDE